MDALLRRRLMMQQGGGPTPPPHTLVLYSYIKFDGQAYIDTDIVIPADGSLRVGLGNETTKAAQGVFSAGENVSGRIALWYSSATTTTNRRMAVAYDSTAAIASDRNLSFSTSVTYTFFMTPLRYGWGTTGYTYTKGSQHPTGKLSLGFSASGTHYTGTMQIVRVYDEDAKNCTTAAAFNSYTNLYSLQPCTYDGEPGMWCAELNAFYGNSAGAGTLTVYD